MASSKRPRPTANDRRAASRRSNAASRAPMLLIGTVALLLVVMVGLFVFGGDEAGDAPDAAAPGSIAALTSVPASTLETVGIPGPPRNVNVLPAGTGPVEDDGKPVVLYYGAEFCPFCAVQRWPVVVALSRFGTFSGLRASASAPPPETLPNTPTVTFHGATYASEYLTLSAVETATRDFTPLETPTPEQDRLFATYNVQSVTGSSGGIPFMMVGNRYAWAGSQYDPSVLSGLTFDEIVAALTDPTTDLAVAVGGAANYLTAMICELTDGRPEDVCATPLIQQAQAALPTP